MSNDNENNNQESKQPLRLSKPGKLELRKTVDAGQVKQSFSHGRSKTVVVEKRTKRTFERGSTGKMAAVPNQELAEGLANLNKSTASGEAAEPPATPRRTVQPAPTSKATDNLTASERVKRMAVLEQAKGPRSGARRCRLAEEAERREAERKAREASERDPAGRAAPTRRSRGGPPCRLNAQLRQRGNAASRCGKAAAPQRQNLLLDLRPHAQARACCRCSTSCRRASPRR